MSKRDSDSLQSDGPQSKKLRLADSIFDDLSKKVRWNDIERTLTVADASSVATAEPGWIEGRVRMIFKRKDKTEAQLCSSEGLQLRILICCPGFADFKFAVGQQVRLSLRGACVRKTKGGSSAPNFMQFSLDFNEGASIQFISGGKTMRDGEVLDMWQTRDQALNNDELMESPEDRHKDWYSTPAAPPPDFCFDEAPADLERKGSEPPLSLREASSSLSTSSPSTPGKDNSVSPELSIAVGGEDISDEGVQRAAKSGKFHRMNASETVKPHEVESKQELSALEREASSSPNAIVGVTPSLDLSKAEREPHEHEKVTSASPPPSPPRRNPSLDLVAGISSEGGAYPPLADIVKNQFTQVIGIVAATEEPIVTCKGDHKVTMMLVDPSKFQYGAGFKVTFFIRPGFAQLLPSPSIGHVLLLKNVKTADWYGNVNGTIYAEKLKWIAYNPSTGKVYFSPGADSLSAPFGPAFNPFYKAKEQEIGYFVQLGEWWRAVKEEEECGVLEIQDYSRNRKEHRLFGDCDVNVFFNATVEVVKHYDRGEHDQSMLLLSDYTPHRLLSSSGPYGQWAISALTSKIPEEVLGQMTVGSFWRIKNIRLKLGREGNLEIDLFAAECSEINDEDHANDQHMQALLKRKETYLLEHPPEVGGGQRPSDNALSAISDIVGNGHYNIIAELLFRNNALDDVSDLYVTDYTDNSLLATYKPNALERVLDGRPISFFKIGAWGERDIVRDMEVGCIYQISDVRVSLDRNGGLKGGLKYPNQRITKVNIKKNDSPAVIALFKRKGELKHRMSKSSEVPLAQTPKDDYEPDIGVAVRSRHTDQPKSTIEEIKGATKCPNKYRLVARVVDFFPMDISDFTVRRCRKCKKMIPDNRNACTLCDDMSGELVEWVFRFFFILEDTSKEKILVDICSEAKVFLAGLDPCDLHSDRNALMALKRRLRGCLGNLVEVHEGLKRQELVEAQYGPFLDLAIKSWEVDDADRKKVVYSLTGCEAVMPIR
ncbi:hypothetical protein M0805_007179 [Coniferiporia weirii]|nr:hypothetical protein M0805_007179 [Coniferiporia weirii]